MYCITGGNQHKKSVDVIGRVRPNSFVLKTEIPMKKSKIETPCLTKEKQNTSVSDTNHVNDVQQNIKQNTQFHGSQTKLSDGVCSKADYTEILHNIIANSDNDAMLTDDSDDILSDEKWYDIMQKNSLDSDEDEEADQSSENSRVIPDQPIYPGHTLTVQTSMVLILLFTLCHGISGTQLADLLTLISIHCLHPHPGIKSVYKFKQFFSMFSDVKSPVRKHFYCMSCMSPVNETDQVCQKRNCNQPLNNSRAKGYFLEMPLENQLRNILQKDDTQTLLKERFSRKMKKENCIGDIYDGSVYKSFSIPGGPLSTEFPLNVSFTWNTDGVPIFKSSKFSIWPFYLAINELPYKHRMRKENLLFCGLWFGETKPVMTLYSKPLLNSLQTLETEGIEIEINDKKCISKGFLLCGTADLPAKSLVMNCNQFNGAFSCMKCLDPGKTFKTDKGGCVHVFPFDASKPVFELRQQEECLKDAYQSIQQKKTVQGIKGPSFLMGLKAYDFVKSTSIDYMHGVLLGVTKLLINLWIGSSNSKQGFSISGYVEILDERLTQIKPPSFITRIPRTISDHFKYWKASELRSWLFYYSLPVLCDILPTALFMHYACFVEGIYLLCTDCVTHEDLQRSYRLLAFFVHMFPAHYGERYMTLNMHSLLHLPKCVDELGPLWVFSCFPFEDINGTLLDLFHGTQNVEFQIMYSINIVQNMSKMLQCVSGSKYKDFIDKLRHNRPQNKPSSNGSLNCVPLGADVGMKISHEIYAKLVSEIGFRPHNIFIYKRVSLQGNTIHSSMYSRVYARNTFTVKYFNSDTLRHSYGSVWHFLLAKRCNCKEKLCKCQSELIAVMYEYDQVKESLVERNSVSVVVPHIKVVKRTNRLKLVHVSKLVSVVVNVTFSDAKELHYLCEVPNMMESD